MEYENSQLKREIRKLGERNRSTDQQTKGTVNKLRSRLLQVEKSFARRARDVKHISSLISTAVANLQQQQPPSSSAVGGTPNSSTSAASRRRYACCSPHNSEDVDNEEFLLKCLCVCPGAGASSQSQCRKDLLSTDSSFSGHFGVPLCGRRSPSWRCEYHEDSNASYECVFCVWIVEVDFVSCNVFVFLCICLLTASVSVHARPLSWTLH